VGPTGSASIRYTGAGQIRPGRGALDIINHSTESDTNNHNHKARVNEH